MHNSLIDWTDPRITAVMCRNCGRVVPVAKDSQLHREQLCDRCSRKVDTLLQKAIQRGLA